MSKYGRLCNKNRDQYRKDVNFLYWYTTCSTAQIAKNLGISETSVDKLIRPKPKGVQTPQRQSGTKY